MDDDFAHRLSTQLGKMSVDQIKDLQRRMEEQFSLALEPASRRGGGGKKIRRQASDEESDSN